MKRKNKHSRHVWRAIITVFAMLFSIATANAQVPTISPTMSYDKPILNDDGTIGTGTEHVDGATSISDASCPLTVTFYANPKDDGEYDATYEWRFYKHDSQDTKSMGYDSIPFLIRFEENTEYTFTDYRSNKIILYATFSKNGKVIYEYTEEYWSTKSESECLTVSTANSMLAFPNAFSPNGDKINDVFRAKKGFKSIVEFHAYIYNRWGQMIYDWTDPAGGWDGTYKGKPVKQGVYFLYCKAKGSEGHKWEFKQDINLLRTYNEDVDTPNQ